MTTDDAGRRRQRCLQLVRLGERDGSRALLVLERGEPIVAPDLIVAEVCNAA